MLKLWHKFRSGPISSQVISGLILTAILAAGSWLASANVRGGLGATRGWLSATTSVPRWLLVAGGLVILVAAITMSRNRLKKWKLRREDNSDPIGAWANKMLTQPLSPPVRPPTVVPGDFKPSDDQRRALTYLLHVYPSKKYLNDLHQHTRCSTPAHTEAEIHRLIAANVMMRENSDASTFYGLTEAGKDAAMKWCKGMTPNPRQKPGYYG